MARPALSAARGIEIIDLLAAQPGQFLTLSDIARRAGINVASCHAVLTVLVERGYLRRDAQTKSYALGPALHAVGRAALAGQPLLAHAEAAARRLFAELGVPVLMTAAVGDDILGVVSIGGDNAGSPLLRAGERRAAIPPTGGAFVAWKDEAEVEAWLARAPVRDPASLDALRNGAAAIRERGFEVLLQPAESTSLASQVSAMAAGAAEVLHMGPGMELVVTIDPERPYDVMMIAAPIFDRQGGCAFNLCLGPFPGPMTGQATLDLADRLLAACVAVMRADRAR